MSNKDEKVTRLPAYTRLPGEADSPDALAKALKQAHEHTRDERKQAAMDAPTIATYWYQPKSS